MFSTAVHSMSPSSSIVSVSSSTTSVPPKKNKTLIQSNFSKKKTSSKTSRLPLVSKTSTVPLPTMEFNPKGSLSVGQQRLKSQGSNSLKFSIDSLLTRKERPASPAKEESPRETKTPESSSPFKRDSNQRISSNPKIECNQTEFDDDDHDIEVEDEDNISNRSEDEGSDSCEDRISVSSTASVNPFALNGLSFQGSHSHPHSISFPQMTSLPHSWPQMMSPHNHHPFLGWMRTVQSNSLSPSSTLLSKYLDNLEIARIQYRL
jgi:hypothetical protein